MSTPTRRRGQEDTPGPMIPLPPPPPQDRRLQMLVACERAARQANRVFEALCLDDTASLDATMRAWDVAAAADGAYWRLARRISARRRWQGIRPA